MKKHILLSLALVLAAQNCITLPPITLTGPKTATEKQIIGEENELEEDVWMISSARATTEVDLRVRRSEREEMAKETTLAEKAFAIFDLFSEELALLREDGVVGENRNGLLSNMLEETGVELPEKIREKYAPETAGEQNRTLVSVVREINKARLMIAESYILNQQRNDPEFRANPAEIIRSQRENYRNAAQKGEFIQMDDGNWKKK